MVPDFLACISFTLTSLVHKSEKSGRTFYYDRHGDKAPHRLEILSDLFFGRLPYGRLDELGAQSVHSDSAAFEVAQRSCQLDHPP